MLYREVALLKQAIDLDLTLPGSKSITNRAFLCAALAQGPSRIQGALWSDDTQVMMKALLKLRITNYELRNGDYGIHGTGGQFSKTKMTLHLGNAGTATRFLTAIMALRLGKTVITGDKRMQERPIRDLADALIQLGATIDYKKKKGYPPFEITAPIPETPEDEYRVNVKGEGSSQYLSALLMLGPLLAKPLRIEVVGEPTSKPYIDTTLAVMKAFGVKVYNHDYKNFLIQPQPYHPCTFRVEGDASAASYFYSLHHLHGGRLHFLNLGKDSIQGDALYPQSLQKLGQGPIDMNSMPDVAMTLAVTAPFAAGDTEIRNVANLRIKESDRLTALETELKKVGVVAQADSDSLRIKPLGNRLEHVSRLTEIETYEDHRMAMCFAVLGTKIPGVRILNPGCVSKTYPDFWLDLEKAYLAPVHSGDKNIVLIGMRGCGKNHLGQLIAARLKRPFIDLDEAIEKEVGMPVVTIVEKFGWEYFRNIEQKTCSSFDRAQDDKFSKPLVIATGGGVVLNALNMKYLKENTLTIFVFVNPPVLVERIQKEKGKRPPLNAGETAVSEVERVWGERRDLYLGYADIVWDNTSGKIVESYINDIFPLHP